MAAKIPRIFKIHLSTMYRMLVNYDMAMRGNKPITAGSYKHIYETAREELLNLVSWDLGSTSGIYSEGSHSVSDEFAEKRNRLVRDKIHQMDAQMENEVSYKYQPLRHW